MKLVKLKGGKWTAVSEQVYLVGTLDSVRTALAQDFGIKTEEIDSAVAEIEKRGHTFADFGVCGRWTFTAVA